MKLSRLITTVCFLLGGGIAVGCGSDSGGDVDRGRPDTGDPSSDSSSGASTGSDSVSTDSGSSTGSSTGESTDSGGADTATPGTEATDTDQPTGGTASQSDTVSPDTGSLVDTETTSGSDTSWPCNPGSYPRCKDLGTIQTCTQAGVIEEPCQQGKSCCNGECLDNLCTPNQQFSCVDDASYQICDSCGTSLVSYECPQDFYCDEENQTCSCEYPVNIMFVVDASGSMQLSSVSGQTQWDIARAAIADVMASYPRLVYGLSTFPDRTVSCNASHICEGSAGCDYTEDVIFDLGQNDAAGINNYLAARTLATTPNDLLYVMTPLVAMFEHLVDTYPTDGPVKTHQYPSYLVLISDGEDSCYNPLRPDAAIGPLGRAVRKLVDDWSVKTYAIGFNLTGGENQLDAISMNGGTGRASFIPATNPKDLKTALGVILASINPRNCSGQDPILEPNCVVAGFSDADGDGWCSSLDCNDNMAAVNPGQFEVASNGVDDNCDSLTDVADEDYDDDGDGRSENQGDCDDAEPLIGPDAMEVVDGLDNDCDNQTDEVEACDCGTASGTSVDNFACAAELSCLSRFAGSRSISSPTGDNLTSPNRAYNAVTRFGSSSNGLAPRGRSTYALLGTGDVLETIHNDDLAGSTAGSDSYSKDGYSVFDVVEYSITLTAPRNARGFSIDYVFFSSEYDEYVGSEYNDKFYIFMNGPQTTGGANRIINFTDCRNPGAYSDFGAPACPLPSGSCCYVAINTALSECCWYGGCSPAGNTDISGTGFSCGSKTNEWSDGGWDVSGGPTSGAYQWGSSTGWLKTTWTAQPGETFTLKFHIHDTSDYRFDSEVILDNFTWYTTAVTPGTEPI